MKLIHKYNYIFYSIILAISVIILNRFNLFQIGHNFKNNIFTASLTFLGLLFTVFSIVIVLPDNKFVKALKEIKLYNVICRTIYTGIISSLITIVISIFNFTLFEGLFFKISICTFSTSLVCTVFSAHHLYKISKLNMKYGD